MGLFTERDDDEILSNRGFERIVTALWIIAFMLLLSAWIMLMDIRSELREAKEDLQRVKTEHHVITQFKTLTGRDTLYIIKTGEQYAGKP